MAAYDKTYLYDCYVFPVLAFDAELPSFAVIGSRFTAVEEAADQFHWSGDAPEGISWRELVNVQEVAESNSVTYRIECGERDSVTDDQKRLFDWLNANQERVLEEIKPAVVGLFQETLKWRAGEDDEDIVLFPSDATDEEKLDRFLIGHFQLDPSGKQLTIELESHDVWYEEHGCSIVLRDGRLAEWGSWDDINEDDDA